MIFHPRVGQRVRIHYNRHVAPYMPNHGCMGKIVAVGSGPGPRNVMVELDLSCRVTPAEITCQVTGLRLVTYRRQHVVVPRGNLVPISDADTRTEGGRNGPGQD